MDRTVTWHQAERLAPVSDRPAWLAARRTRITSTDVAKAMTPSGWRQVVSEKLYGIQHPDNAYMDHGRKREPVLAAMARNRYGVLPNEYLYARGRYAATPDGVHPDKPQLSEIKTATRAMPRTFPRIYRDQVYLAQYVFDAERTLLVWEHHKDGVPIDIEPEFRWLERDDDRIQELINKGDQLADFLTAEGLTIAN